MNSVVNAIQRVTKSKKLPLIILHRNRVNGGNAKAPYNQKILESWRKAGALYATPPGSNDDWWAPSSFLLAVVNTVELDHVPIDGRKWTLLRGWFGVCYCLLTLFEGSVLYIGLTRDLFIYFSISTNHFFLFCYRYWLYAAVSCRSLLVTNDEMRDHLFQLLGTSFFPRWKEKHQVFSYKAMNSLLSRNQSCST